MSSSAELKALGNKSFASKDYKSAIDLYSQAIQAAKDPKADALHVLYSNRSACHSGLKDWDAALQDAEKTIELDPSFSKGYGRKGGALHGARKLQEAIEAYEQGLALAPGDKALEKGKEDAQRALDSSSRGGGGDEGLGKMFSDPQLFSKLAANPKTASLLSDPGFMAKLKQIQSNPNDVMGAMSDPRMIQVMGVLMGIDMQAFERPEGSNDLPSDLEKNREEIERQTQASTSSHSKTTPTKKEEVKKEETKDVEMEDVEDDEDAKAKKSAEEEKKLGNASYLKREFDSAIPHYEKAWELYPKDITFLNNLGACHFEKGDYDSAIKTCEKAIEEGRSIRADYKSVAKAFGRIGSSYLKKDDLEKAISNFEKSLTEHRTPEILNKLRETEKEQKERVKRAYVDPVKSDEERNRGNDLYKKGDYPASVNAYTESIKRNPNDPRGFTNRASAYTKLAALPEALKDCEEAIKVDPKFIKAYIRRSNVQFAMKEFSKALESCQRAADLDDEISTNGPGKGPNAREIASQQEKCFSAMYSERSGESDEQTLQRAMRDPEVAKIMQDPVMQSILQQAQSNPAALQDHMKNPQIREKVQKLIAAGIIKTR